MSLLASLFTETFRDPAECLVKVDGEEISHLYGYISEIKVQCTRAEGCTATITFDTRRDEEGTWLVQDDDALLPWKPIEIIAAFGSSHEEPVMQGYIQQVDASYPDLQGSASVTVHCRDSALLLDREQHRLSHGTEDAPVSDGDILQTILGSYPELSASADNADGQASLIQVNQDDTDISFLRSRATANGYELLFEGNEVYFGPPRVDADAQSPIMVYAGNSTNCVNFSVSFDGHQPDKVAYEVASREDDSITEQEVVSDLPLMGTASADSSSAGLGDFTWRLTRPGALADGELQGVALGRANEAAMKIKATGQLDGTLYGNVLHVGKPVVVDGVGTRYNGTYYVDAVDHLFNYDGYKQDFKLLRNAHGEDI